MQGGAGADRLSLRDGRATEVACGAGRDSVVADPRDVLDIDCESARVAPQPGGARLTVATLPFPFPGVNDRGRSTIAVEPLLPLHGDAIVLRVSCPAGLGLLELVRAAAMHRPRALHARGRLRDGHATRESPRAAARSRCTCRCTASRALARAARRASSRRRDRDCPTAGDVTRALQLPRARLRRRLSPTRAGPSSSPASLSCSQYSSAGSCWPVQTIAWPVLWIWSARRSRRRRSRRG